MGHGSRDGTRIYTDLFLYLLFLCQNIIEMKHEILTEQIIKVFYQVYNELGYGFLEKV